MYNSNSNSSQKLKPEEYWEIDQQKRCDKYNKDKEIGSKESMYNNNSFKKFRQQIWLICRLAPALSLY